MLLKRIRKMLRESLPNITVVPKWETEWWLKPATFAFAGTTHQLFCHTHNCGWPPARMTERSVELAIADYWLSQISGPIVEIGAVTPYYWPGRVPRVIDPADEHPGVTDSCSLFDVDVAKMNVICLSTLEHVGSGEYGLPVEVDGPIRALQYLTEKCAQYLISLPFGYHPSIDRQIFSPNPPLPARYLVRSTTGNDWRECAWRDAIAPIASRYGESKSSWANGLAILSRGGGL